MSSNTDYTSTSSPDNEVKEMMSDNIHDAQTIFELCAEKGYLNSQEFIDWQDELNKISVKYG